MKSRVATPFLAVLLISAVCVSAFAVPRSQIKDDYKWKPEHIYASVQKWEEDLQAIRSGLDALAAFKGQFSGPDAKNPAQSLIAYNKLNEQLKIKFEQVEAYCSYNFHVDMGNSEWVGRNQQVEDLTNLFSEKTSWFEPELLTIPRATLMQWVDANPALQTYRKTYEDMYLLQEHTLSQAEEQILAQAGNITETAADVFGKMTNVDMRWGYLLDDKGDSVQITDEGWTSWRVSQNRRIREEYFRGVWNGYKAYENTFAALMAGNLRKNVFLSRARKYDNTLQHSLNSVFVPEAVYLSLINSARAGVAPLHKYEEVRKRVLGLDHYRHWDYYVSLVKEDEARYTWEQGATMVIDALKPLGKEYVADITHALNSKNGWVDVYANDGKRGGAYSSSTYGIHPYMLYNFDSEQGMTLEDVSTVAHEVGHSMHTLYSERKQPYPNRDYAYFNAEVASTTNETIMNMKLLDDARGAYKKAKGKEKEAAKQRLVYLLDQNLASARGSFYRQTIFAAWELEANRMAEKGEPLTAESFNKAYGNLIREFYGPALEYEDISNIEWARIPHFYRVYYVYTYATSYAAAVALAKDIRDEAAGVGAKKGATARFVNFLKSGSSKHPVDLLKDAGVDMTTSAPFESCTKYLGDLVNELDQLTKTQ